MTHPIVQEFLKGENGAGGTISQLEFELESETRWAKHYFDKWQSAQQSVQRTAIATGGLGLLAGFVIGFIVGVR
jgi:hypothetical protein